MLDNSKIRTPEERSRKMLKEEKTVIDLELAVKKEESKSKNKADRLLKEEKTIVDLELAVKKEEFKRTPKEESTVKY